jgi:hypothetical protein
LWSCVLSSIGLSASGWSLIQRSPTECGVSECDRESSIMRRPWPTRGCRAMGGGGEILICVQLVSEQICATFYETASSRQCRKLTKSQFRNIVGPGSEPTLFHDFSFQCVLNCYLLQAFRLAEWDRWVGDWPFAAREVMN